MYIYIHIIIMTIIINLSNLNDKLSMYGVFVYTSSA